MQKKIFQSCPAIQSLRERAMIRPNIVSRSADWRVEQHDGHDTDIIGPIQDRIPPSTIADRVMRRGSTDGITEMSVDMPTAWGSDR
eukprot:8541870-Pyramimonas_sp.AAC.1